MERDAASLHLHGVPDAGQSRHLRAGLTPHTLLATFVALLLLTGCVAAPAVFEREAENRLLALPDSAGIVVGAMLGFEAEEETRRELVAALQRENVPASVGTGNRASYRLDGWIEPDGGRGNLLLRDPRNAVLGRFDAPATDPRGFAVALAPRIAELVQAGGPASRTRSPAVAPQMPVHVERVAGLPERDGDTLALALGTALRGRGLAVTRTPDPEALSVSGDVTVTPAGAEQRRVQISWRVTRPDGTRVGTITQDNTVPAAELEGGWGPIAPLVGEAAAEGVAPVVEQAALEQRGDGD